MRLESQDWGKWIPPRRNKWDYFRTQQDKILRDNWPAFHLSAQSRREERYGYGRYCWTPHLVLESQVPTQHSFAFGPWTNGNWTDIESSAVLFDLYNDAISKQTPSVCRRTGSMLLTVQHAHYKQPLPACPGGRYFDVFFHSERPKHPSSKEKLVKTWCGSVISSQYYCFCHDWGGMSEVPLLSLYRVLWG